ncbi:MAG: WD40/YVTN/BNR-like repeat-containing protein, partial [Planctomycetota bacterium]
MRMRIVSVVVAVLFMPLVSHAQDEDTEWVTLLHETFDNPELRHPSWDFLGGLLEIETEGDRVYGVMSERGARVAWAGSREWNDYSLEIRFRVTGPMEFQVRTRDGDTTDDHYVVVIAALQDEWAVMTNAECSDGPMRCSEEGVIWHAIPQGFDQWHTLVIINVGSQFELRLDDQPLMETDVGTTAPPDGYFELRVPSGESQPESTSVLHLDEITLVGRPPADSWVRVNGPTGGAYGSIAPHPTDPDTIAVEGKHSGIWVTRDGGQTWTLELHGLNSVDTVGLYRNPYKPELLLEANGNGSWYYSFDDAHTWHNVAVEGGTELGLGVGPLAFSPVIEDRVYIAVGGPGCVLRSDNGGRSFSRLSGASGTCGSAINQIVVTADPGNDEQEWIWLATAEEGLGRSVDGGLSWEFSTAIPMANDLAVFDEGNRIIAVTTEGLYSATNADSADLAGLNWTLVSPAQELSDLHSIRRVQDGTIYVVGAVVILISRDDGATFQGLEIPLAAPIVDLALHP